MNELLDDPTVTKLLEHGKKKKSLTYHEVNDFLPESMIPRERLLETP